MKVSVSSKYCEKFLENGELDSFIKKAEAGYAKVLDGTGEGNDFLGWRDLPSSFPMDEIRKIEETADYLKKAADVLVVIGIGGSYLGSLAAISALNKFKSPDGMEIIFAGNNMCSSWYEEIFEKCRNKEVAVNVISKSGSTTETAIAFRLFRNYMESRYGAKASQRIIMTTGANGTLRNIAQKEGYVTFPVPEDVGGRYSVLSHVGLLPIACAGIDIRELLNGAKQAQKDFLVKENNQAVKYAALRNAFYNKGKVNEITVTNRENMKLISAWMQQLFAESEGKDEKGILPVPAFFTSDLHSVGQYIQNGLRNMFETVIEIKEDISISIPDFSGDGFPFLDGKTVGEINEKALTASVIAHEDGGVPVIRIYLGEMSPYALGYAFYFFESACAVSAYTLGVNPFNQPSVEEYKKNMFALLGKEGYEELGEKLKSRI